MGKKNKKKKNQLFEDNKGVQAVQNQLNESYQSGVVEDQLENNRGINHFNNKSR
ncbi:hypothetical protein [Oceanobacillus jeddahense]|uniref:Glycogen biosynthesis protein GlgD n=1 Tax=Oceanobacillus jeddahense TaxID=1462527 RepID=A0ABY5JL61_9BACI|nr:hypothetical protein [Oceanobacillus jeddahense]UUI01037.1 hypothetical protein NP439_13220 [Oceanobacillus jeddahense]